MSPFTILIYSSKINPKVIYSYWTPRWIFMVCSLHLTLKLRKKKIRNTWLKIGLQLKNLIRMRMDIWKDNYDMVPHNLDICYKIGLQFQILIELYLNFAY